MTTMSLLCLNSGSEAKRSRNLWQIPVLSLHVVLIHFLHQKLPVQELVPVPNPLCIILQAFHLDFHLPSNVQYIPFYHDFAIGFSSQLNSSKLYCIYVRITHTYCSTQKHRKLSSLLFDGIIQLYQHGHEGSQLQQKQKQNKTMFNSTSVLPSFNPRACGDINKISNFT